MVSVTTVSPAGGPHRAFGLRSRTPRWRIPGEDPSPFFAQMRLRTSLAFV